MKTLLLWFGAFAAGFLGWRVAVPAPTAARAAAREVAAAPEAPPVEAAEAPALRRRLGLLATVPLRELVLYGKEPLKDRMRRAKGLEEMERRQTLRDWAQRAVYDRAKAQEMLALVREEEDKEILLSLAEMIDVACAGKLTEDPTFTDDERRAMFPLAALGDPLERRIAALRVIGGDRAGIHKADMQALLADVLRRDSEPAVVAAAAEEIEWRYSPDAIPELLPAWRRLPPGEPRQRVARAYARWAEGPDLKERFREARGPVEYDEWAQASTYCLYKMGKEDIVAIYRGTAARDIRRHLFYALANSDGRTLLREIADGEKDPDLRARYERVLGAERMTPADIHTALYK